MSQHNHTAANDALTSTFLAPGEIRDLTHRVHHSAQSSALNKMGIEHLCRPDGSLAVLRSHVEGILGGKPSKKTKKESEPNWGAIGAKAA